MADMARLSLGAKELFWLDSILQKALADESVPAEIYILAGRVKSAIEELQPEELTP